ncbi:uncharacterized protein LOC114256427 [Camellia sinensis]|uniref:uncharacterized protein LOC114256427 n=1 Tax=Camellia sinensis TaxID=4442 RepID=UPI0010360EC1|nr:uncharacterized protein LOC114256427 [Camellia sinensis]
MGVKPCHGLLILPLLFSYILSSTAMPTSRSLISIKKDTLATNLLAQGGIDVKNDEGKLTELEGGASGKEKIEMESTEYRDQIRSSSMEMMIENNDENDKKMKNKGSMDMDIIMDYPPTGANPSHSTPPPP